MFDALHGLDLAWLHPTPKRPCLNARLLLAALPFSTPYDDMLTKLVCATCWLYMHLYTLAYMSTHESYLLACRPYFNTMKLWTFNFKPTLVPHGHHILFDNLLVCLFTCLLAFLLCLPCLSRLSTLCLFYTLFAPFLSIACLLVSCLCLCMYTYGARMHRARALFPRHKQKGRGRKHVDIIQAAAVSRFRSLVFPIWICTRLNPFLPPPVLS